MKPVLVAAVAFVTLAGCGGGGGSGSGGSSDPAYLSVGVTDAPIGSDVTNVYVQFHGIELKGPDGQVTINFDAPVQIDLLAQTGTTAAALLTDEALTAGEYQWMRLLVDTEEDGDTYLIDSVGNHELTIPSGAQTGLKLNRGFTLAQGSHANFTIDFNVARSVISNAGGYVLKPVLRLVDNLTVGVLAGTVDSALIAADCSENDAGAVYVYSGTVTDASDMQGAETDPLTTAKVAIDGSGSYTVGFLASGTYTAAWTCNEMSDDPEVDDVLTFHGLQTFTITADMTTTLDFDI
jgi:hypothetical protein